MDHAIVALHHARELAGPVITQAMYPAKHVVHLFVNFFVRLRHPFSPLPFLDFGGIRFLCCHATFKREVSKVFAALCSANPGLASHAPGETTGACICRGRTKRSKGRRPFFSVAFFGFWRRPFSPLPVLDFGPRDVQWLAAGECSHEAATAPTARRDLLRLGISKTIFASAASQTACECRWTACAR